MEKWGDDTSPGFEFSLWNGRTLRGHLSDFAAMGPRTNVGKLVVIGIAFAVLMITLAYFSNVEVTVLKRQAMLNREDKRIVEEHLIFSIADL